MNVGKLPYEYSDRFPVEPFSELNEPIDVKLSYGPVTCWRIE